MDPAVHMLVLAFNRSMDRYTKIFRNPTTIPWVDFPFSTLYKRTTDTTTAVKTCTEAHTIVN